MRERTGTILSYCIWVATFTLIIYLLSYNGIPAGSDEELFASVSRNIALNGTTNAWQLYGNHRLESGYHGVEPAFPVLASILYRFVGLFPVGRLQSLYLLPIVLIATTNGLIVFLAVQLGFSIRTGVVGGLLFGLSTMAWVYSKYYYRESLLVFLFVLSWVCFENIFSTETLTRKPKMLPVALAGLLILCILTKVMAISFIFAFFVLALAKVLTGRLRNKNIAPIFVTGILGILGIIIFLSFQKSTDENIFYRYTGSFINDAWVRYKGMSYDHLWEAFLAPLFSPWKGIFIYSLPCLLAFFSLFEKKKPKYRDLFILPGVTTTGFLIIQGLAYNDMWWTSNWSSRFLLPTIPLFIIAALPWIEATLQFRNKYRIFFLSTIAILGSLIQLSAVLFHSVTYDHLLLTQFQNEFPDRVIWSIYEMPLWAQWKLVGSQTQPALLLWRVFPINSTLSVMFIVLGLSLLGWLFFLLKKEITVHVFSLKIFFGLVGITSLFFLFINISSQDPFYYSPRFQDLKTICSRIRSGVKSSDVLIVKPYRGDAWFYFMNNDCTLNEWYSLPFSIDIDRVPAARDLTVRLFDEVLVYSNRVWLVDQVWNSDTEIDSLLLENKFSLINNTEYFLPDSRVLLSLYER